MIHINFWLLEPGRHRMIWDCYMPAVPRVGDLVTLGIGEGVTREVHSVQWFDTEPAKTIRVYLKHPER